MESSYEARSSISPNSRTGSVLHRWRASLIVVLVVPAIFFAFTIKSARASFLETQPILCDGVDDDTSASVLCGLPEETTKELSCSKGTLVRLAKMFSALPSCSQITPVAERRPISFADPANRLQRLLVYGAVSADEPDADH